MKEIASAFIKAKMAFSPALKDKTNPAFRSKYADLGACLEAVNDALLANGIALYQETSEDATGVTVETILLHESGESIRSGKLHLPAAKHDAQGYGSALTYARRYSLMTATGIAPEDDDGNAGVKATTAKGVPMVAADKRSPSVANIVLNDGPPIAEARKAEIATLAANIVKAMEKKGAEWCAKTLAGEELDDMELIFLSTVLPAAINRQLKEAQAKIREEAAA